MAKDASKPRVGISLQIEEDLLIQIDAMAAAEDRTRRGQISALLRKAVADWQRAGDRGA